ncbi:hypothetical protein FGO68_gene16782 [Halteria grandinella]|uniref:Uncharacterized protein n=1 Tax=Halteria grandinella TaxID=5974 RepID=A0A8J8T3D9_HALGN|nr:hypothetical protein FGO68_gene16782 [Halteria grandinella]
MLKKLQQHALESPGKVGLIDKLGKHNYKEIYNRSLNLSSKLHTLLSAHPKRGTEGDPSLKRIITLTDSDSSHALSQYASWGNRAVTIPLSVKATPTEIDYFVNDSQADLIVSQPHYSERISNLNVPIYYIGKDDLTSKAASSSQFAHNSSEDDCLVVYTSGTTGKPKGCMHKHRSVQAQIETLVDYWGWSASDKILNVLPMHHVHGLINVMNCSLWSGATCELRETFKVQDTWEALLRDRSHEDALTLFMAVPTIYYSLIKHYHDQKLDKSLVHSRLSHFRLMVAGSASLPGPTLEEWQSISGQRLLERYGMTEIGMGISNPLYGSRIQGHMGYALPGVKCALRDLESGEIFWDSETAENKLSSGREGELYIKSPCMFDRYINKPEASRETFTEDGWFKTGDCAIVNQIDEKSGMFKHLGRLSQDIIKKGGYKLSALEIEGTILEHPSVSEIVVVGIPDDKHGQEVAAIILFHKSTTSQDELLKTIQDHCKKVLSSYKIPRVWKVVEEIPKNAIGKVVKKDIVKLF